MVVLDTNVLSEQLKANPSQHVLSWISGRRDLSITVVSLQELAHGAHLVTDEAAQTRYLEALELIRVQFTSSTFAVDADAAMLAGAALGTRRRAGRPMSIPDAQIAGICLTRGAALATRNVKDFEGLGIELIDPWAA